MHFWTDAVKKAAVKNVDAPRGERIKELKNWTRSLRSLFGEPLDRTNRITVIAGVDVSAVVA